MVAIKVIEYEGPRLCGVGKECGFYLRMIRSLEGSYKINKMI